MIGIENLYALRNNAALRAKYDEIWVCMRSYKNPDDFAVHVPELSPSTDLFFSYRNMLNNGVWNESTFRDFYTPQFLQEIAANLDARQALNTLWRADKNGKRIALVCSCSKEKLCHRSILAGLLMGVGATVEADRGYMKYYDQWQAISATA